MLLGDLVELRERPVAQVLADALPVLRRIGEAVSGKRITIVPGNHDHYLASPLLDATAGRLELETVTAPPASGPVAEIAGALGGSSVRIAYPGVWVRPDVFATHGHYLDVHNTVPSFERLAIGAVQRVAGGLPSGGRLTPDDYEAAVGPVYALTYAMAQSARGAEVGGGRRGVRADVAARERLERRPGAEAAAGPDGAAGRDRRPEPRRARAAQAGPVGGRAAPRGAAPGWPRWCAGSASTPST